MTLAIFDLDDTLIDGDSASLWLGYMVQQGWADGDMLHTEQQMMRTYHLGDLSMLDYMNFWLKPLCGIAVAEIAQRADAFVSALIPPRVFPAARRQMDWHLQQGHQLLIISATADFIVRRVASMLGVDDVIAIELEEKDGCYTGSTQGVLSFHAGKVQRLQVWMDSHGSSLQGSYGYSDSVNDLPLLRAVEHASVVNPSSSLEKISDQHQWHQCHWQLDCLV